MARGAGGEALFGYAELDGGIIEISFLDRTWCKVPTEQALANRQYCLNVAAVPWMNWTEVDPDPVTETSGFGTEVPW